jgi:hypothetical protein
MKQLIGLAAALAVAASATAAEREVAITVYNQDFALVKDRRPLDLVAGTQEIRIDDVAASIDATSVHFKAVEHPDQVAVLEQNYRYDLASADRLLDRYLDRPVTLVLEDGTRSGILRSYAGGALVLADDDGGMNIVSRGTVRDIRLGSGAEGLVTRPTLVWTVASDRTGAEPVEISYLTNNISWHAEYVAVVNADDTALDLSGWVSIDNRSGGTYENATLKLVAGDVNRVQEYQRVGRMEAAMSMDAVAEKQFESGEFFEYHIYKLQRPATVADRETKQLSLFPSASAAVTKKMVYDGARTGSDVQVRLAFDNSEDNGLGMPLPAGKLRVFKKDRDGALEFAGEDRIDHTPRDEKLDVYLGNAFDVKGERKRTDYRKIASNVMEETFEVEVRNHKDDAVAVEIVEHRQGDWEVLSEPLAHEKRDSHTMVYEVEIPANGSITIEYTVRTTW